MLSQPRRHDPESVIGGAWDPPMGSSCVLLTLVKVDPTATSFVFVWFACKSTHSSEYFRDIVKTVM